MVDLHALSFPFVFENALGYSRYDPVVSTLDLLKTPCELRVVIVELRWPVSVTVVRSAVVSPCFSCCSLLGIDVMISARLVLAWFYTWVW